MRVITQELQDEPVAERAVIMTARHPAVQAARVKYMRARQIPDLVLFLYHVQTDGTAKTISDGRTPFAWTTYHTALSKICGEAF